MFNHQTILESREEYKNLVKNELLGPGSEVSIPDVQHELISSAADSRYSMGILFTKNNKLNVDNNDAQVTSEGEIDEVIHEEIGQNVGGSDLNKPKTFDNLPEEDNLDEEISLAAQNMPSSMGITFFAKGDTSQVFCNLSFGTYRKAKVDDCRIPFFPEDPDTYVVPIDLSKLVFFDRQERTLRFLNQGLQTKEVTQLKDKELLEIDEYGLFDSMYKLATQLRSGYVRIPHSLDLILDFRHDDYIDANKELDGTKAKVTALRRSMGEDLYSITIMLVNDNNEKSSSVKCLYQPLIKVSTDHNNFVFHEHQNVSDFLILDDEEISLEMQYRNKRKFGTGLGTSVDWDIDENGYGEIFNDFFPEVEVPSMDFSLPPDSNIDTRVLSMKYLSDLNDCSKSEKLNSLSGFIETYKVWIEALKIKSLELEPKFHFIANKNILGCEISYDRMRRGIKALEVDDTKWNAFALANRAMFIQRVHIKLQEKTSNINRFPDDVELTTMLETIDYYKGEEDFPDNYAWRPFQLAFMLMSVESVSNDSVEDRDLVDLIWFPTGGGKTEAYLGLTAFAIFYRRLQHGETSSGTTVIMRYTLRLLAAQQFTRASTLICACEFIRYESTQKRSQFNQYSLGQEKISIGLWIGGNHTPNKNADAKQKLQILQNANPQNLKDLMQEYHKFQVLKCPWCGTKLVKEVVGGKLVGEFGYRLKNNSHFEIFCPQEKCFFNKQGKLPIQIVDEELYSVPPTLLFGTVDKFAMLPWKKEIGVFLGVGRSSRAPELVIQDELHLISGPLGTMVGLYEIVLDALSSAKGVKPKIVASTATIRRAKEQCAALYNREVSQFPHPGLDADDSFFARESSIDYESGIYGRKYIGLMPSGKTKAMMEVRAIATLLQKINEMKIPDEIKDKFWTLTVYFNSLKDLGKCSTLVDDDVKDFIKRAAYRLGTARDGRKIAGVDELTSRVTTSELNETLDKLEKLEYSKENLDSRRYPSNVLLATNMISVGIDVARLNVMLLVGQPKLTSEYIQASSRIGRAYPGLAFVMFDGSKSRDRSHYEQFKSYHESFYKFVEPTVATPFSKPARDRALHAVAIALLRHLEPMLSSEVDAGKFSVERFRPSIDKIKDYIIKRDSEILTLSKSRMEPNSIPLNKEIESIFEDWERMAKNYDEDHFVYGEKYMMIKPDQSVGRLMKVFNSNRYDAAIDTMTSMRNVDTTVATNVLIWKESK